jgi:hypothetical protein
LFFRPSTLSRLAAAARGLAISRRLSLSVLAGREVEPQSEDHCPTVLPLLLSIPGDRAPASRTYLLALQPAFEAAKVQDMPARELLGAATLDLASIGGIPGAHFLSANDAGILSAKVFGGGVWILIHVFQGLAVADEGVESL